MTINPLCLVDSSSLAYEPQHDKTNKMTCASSDVSDQPGHLPSLIYTLIRVFTVRMKKAWALSFLLTMQRRLWSDWADAQTDLSLHWAHVPFCWFYHAATHIHIWGIFSTLLLLNVISVRNQRILSSDAAECSMWTSDLSLHSLPRSHIWAVRQICVIFYGLLICNISDINKCTVKFGPPGNCFNHP